MSDCCLSTESVAKKQKCPVCSKDNQGVSVVTILHHIKTSQDGAVINTTNLRTIVGIKSQAKGALICYCFGVSVAEASLVPEAREFVVEQTRQGSCACATRNPSGRCCLKDFPKLEITDVDRL